MMIKRLTRLRILIFLLAFCSIVYELLFAQGLSAFLENSVLRYSVTIGLYMCSLGFGSLLAEGRILQKSALVLFWAEFLLVIFGGFSVVWMHSCDMLPIGRFGFSIIVHALIISVGVLSGMEIPLLINLAHQERPAQEGVVLGLNYGGAFLGAVVFAFVFYPRMGLMASAFLIGSLNALVGGILLFDKDFREQISKAARLKCVLAQTLMGFGVIVCLVFSGQIAHFFIKYYLG